MKHEAMNMRRIIRAQRLLAEQGHDGDTLGALDELAALRKDAERYRWLRRWKGQEHEPPFTVQHEVDGILWGGDLDAAIDAARAVGAA